MQAERDELSSEADQPLHPIIVEWVRIYAAAPESERDSIVARILTDWNRALMSRGNSSER
jgi:hypothetical protein